MYIDIEIYIESSSISSWNFGNRREILRLDGNIYIDGIVPTGLINGKDVETARVKKSQANLTFRTPVQLCRARAPSPDSGSGSVAVTTIYLTSLCRAPFFKSS